MGSLAISLVLCSVLVKLIFMWKMRYDLFFIWKNNIHIFLHHLLLV